MKQNEMFETLTQQSDELREELLKLEQEFNIKKEQYIKIQGALEVLIELKEQENSN